MSVDENARTMRGVNEVMLEETGVSGLLIFRGGMLEATVRALLERPDDDVQRDCANYALEAWRDALELTREGTCPATAR